MSNVVHSTSGNTQWLLVCLQVCTLYMHVHVDGSNTLYGPAVKFQTGLHNCRLQASICTGPQTKGVGVTNVPWDHLSGPQTYINDVECNK